MQAVLAARIDRLPAEDKRLLQTAAVIGKDVPFALLQAIAELPEDGRTRRARPPAGAPSFCTRRSLFPELEYTFKHALTQEVAYGSLLQERRRALHARIVEAIERLYPDRLDEQVERLAHHALRGEVWERPWRTVGRPVPRPPRARPTGKRSGASSRRWSRCSISLSSRTRSEQAIDLRFNLRNALLPLGEQAQIFDHLRAAETLAEALHDERRLGRAFAYLAEYFRMTGDCCPRRRIGRTRPRPRHGPRGFRPRGHGDLLLGHSLPRPGRLSSGGWTASAGTWRPSQAS